MARVFITGSADGLGRLAAQTLLDDRHEVVVNVRNSDRVEAVGDLVDRGAAVVVGDLSDLEQTRSIARDVNRLGRMDAVIHNAGVYRGRQVMPVNIVAPTCSLPSSRGRSASSTSAAAHTSAGEPTSTA